MVTRQRSHRFGSGVVLAVVAFLAAPVVWSQVGFAAATAPASKPAPATLAPLVPAPAPPAAPATVRIGPIKLTIPQGFEVAQRQKQKGTLIAAWTKSVRDGSVKTLLQVTVYDLGSRPGKAPSTADLAEGAQQYLRQSLGAIEQRRDRFKSSPVAHIKLADLPAVRASWNGAVAARDAVGVMYCVIVRNRFAVILHTQDLGNVPSEGMLDAMKSIESVTLAGES